MIFTPSITEDSVALHGILKKKSVKDQKLQSSFHYKCKNLCCIWLQMVQIVTTFDKSTVIQKLKTIMLIMFVTGIGKGKVVLVLI